MNNINDNWWKPEQLKKAEKESRSIDNINLLNLNSDFGSYRKVFLSGNLEDSVLSAHNDLNPLIKVRSIFRFLHGFQPKNILDAGCGTGFCSAALGRYFKDANITGIDISEDAIAYAKKNHPGIKFIAESISPNNPEIGLFDLIFCMEFYPFSRNCDVQAQKEFILYFVKQLTQDGKLIIYQKWDNTNSTRSILADIVAELPELNITLRQIPNPKILKYLPNTLAYFANYLARYVVQRDLSHYFITISNPSK